VSYISSHVNSKRITIEIVPFTEVEESELDEMWSFVRTKKNQRRLWLAIDHKTRKIIAYAFGRRKYSVFTEFKKLLKPFGIKRYYTDGYACYSTHIAAKQHTVGKENTQRIERKNLTLRTRIKRLARKTICYSKSVTMHDIIIGLVINILEFGLVFGDHFHDFIT
jgi:insertion element IS1 protein InsB